MSDYRSPTPCLTSLTPVKRPAILACAARLMLLLVASAQSSAQAQTDGWFGQAVPDPARAANSAPSRLERIDIDQLSLQQSAAEDADHILDGDRIAQTMADIIAISR